MTGPMTATVAPALIKLVKLAPTNTTRITNGIPESIPNGSTKPIIDEANQPAAPVDLKTEPREIAPAYKTTTPQLIPSS